MKIKIVEKIIISTNKCPKCIKVVDTTPNLAVISWSNFDIGTFKYEKFEVIEKFSIILFPIAFSQLTLIELK